MKNSTSHAVTVFVPNPTIKQELSKLIPELRDHSPRYPMTAHDAVMGDFYDILDSLRFEYGEENAHKRNCWKTDCNESSTVTRFCTVSTPL